MARVAPLEQRRRADVARSTSGWLAAALSMSISMSLVASCGDTGFYFSASVQPGNGQIVAVDGQTDFASYLWWQHFDNYEHGGQVARLSVEAWVLGAPFVVDTIGPGYCRELCAADWCQAGLVAEETVRIVVNSSLIITGTCIDFDGIRYDISN